VRKKQVVIDHFKCWNFKLLHKHKHMIYSFNWKRIINYRISNENFSL